MERLSKTLCIMVFCCIIALFPCSGAEAQAPAAGEEFPEIRLPLPKEKIYRQYLGVRGGDYLKVPDIKAEIVIVEVLSMYCPFCQAEAPKVNELYTRIENNSTLRNRIKVIGIAAGNSPFEADVFRKKYNIAFPIFPDADFALHKALGEVRTPYFIGIRIEKNKARVFYAKLGGFKEANAFLNVIVGESGLDGKGVSK